MLQTLALTAILFLIIACIRGWVRLWRRSRHGLPLVDFAPRRPVPWTILDLAIAVAVFLMLQLVAGLGMRAAFDLSPGLTLEELPAEGRAGILIANALATLAAALVSLATIKWRAGATWRDVGVQRRYVAEDLRLGVAAFVVLAPPVYFVQMLLVRLAPYEHPLIRMLQERPEPLFLIVSALSALVVAPVVEEYFFRTLLQGWLERLNAMRHAWSHSDTGGSPFALDDEPVEAQIVRTDDGAAPEAPPHASQPAADEDAGPSPLNPYQYRPAPDNRPAYDRDKSPSASADPGVWPIFVTAILFAVMHAPHGAPALVSLTLYALGLGYVYRQTHRLLPCIVAHLALNAVSLATLAIALWGGD